MTHGHCGAQRYDGHDQIQIAVATKTAFELPIRLCGLACSMLHGGTWPMQ